MKLSDGSNVGERLWDEHLGQWCHIWFMIAVKGHNEKNTQGEEKSGSPGKKN